MDDNLHIIKIESDNIFQQEYGDFKDDAKRLNRYDKGFVSPNASLAVKDDRVAMTTNNCQLKMSNNGHSDLIAIQKSSQTNREYIKTDEIIFNNHKFNNKILEYADMRLGLKSSIDQNETLMKSGIIGKFSMFGTILTKAWDPELKRYVLIRRLACMPIFCPEVEI